MPVADRVMVSRFVWRADLREQDAAGQPLILACCEIVVISSRRQS